MNDTLKKLLRLVLPYKWWMLLAAFTGFLTVGSSVGLMMTSAYIIAQAALHPSIAVLQVGIVGVRFFGIARGLFRYTERLVAHEVTFRLLAQLRVWFYRAIEPLAPARLQHYKSGDLLARIISDIKTLENFYVRVIAPPLVAVFVAALMWFLFGIFSWIFSAILLVFLLLAGIGVPLLTHSLSRGLGNQLVEIEAELSVLAVENIQGLPELLLFGQAEKAADHFNALNDRLIKLQRRRARINAMHESLTGLLMHGAVFTLFIVAIPHIQSGFLDGIYLSVLTLGCMAAFEAVMPLPAAAANLEENLRAAQRLFEIVEAPPPIQSPVHPAPPLSSFNIVMKNVNFRYAPDEPPVFSQFNLNINAGDKVAIIGPSGAGKTTIANILLRFWDFQSGEITIGGLDLRAFSQPELAELISCVPQDAFLFNGTIRDNLLLANPSATENELAAACTKAQIHSFISNLPDGYDTWIGEHGQRLSGGERQRLVFARGLLKNTPIYIFDEPTANLDGETATAVLREIVSLPKEKTVIIISHEVFLIEQFRQELAAVISL